MNSGEEFRIILDKFGISSNRIIVSEDYLGLKKEKQIQTHLKRDRMAANTNGIVLDSH